MCDCKPETSNGLVEISSRKGIDLAFVLGRRMWAVLLSNAGSCHSRSILILSFLAQLTWWVEPPKKSCISHFASVYQFDNPTVPSSG